MENDAPPAKRPKYDLANTFEVVVGKEPFSQRFTVYSNVLTPRSDFFKAARKSEWLSDPTKPVDLQNEDPEVFSRYLNCVYFGTNALQLDADAPEDDRSDSGDDNEDEEEEELGLDAFLCSEAESVRIYEEGISSRGKYLQYIYQCLHIFTDLYLLADRLRDVETANHVMDALIRFSDKVKTLFDAGAVCRVYDSTAHANPLRKFMRDECVYDTESYIYTDLHVAGHHPEFARDVMVEFLRVKDANLNEKVGDVYQMHGKHGKHERFADKCRYHQHDETPLAVCPNPRRSAHLPLNEW
ncbi:hypothetical protein MBLNU13_g02125t1 [Cladosporium sp. NU13]